MNTYSVEFTTPLIRDNNLKTRTEQVEAESAQAAEAIVMARHQGVRIVDTLCVMTAIMDPVAVAAHDLAGDLASERADNAELREIIADLKRQVTVARQQAAAANVARSIAELSQGERIKRHENATSYGLRASNNALGAAVVCIAGSPFDRAQGFILSLLDMDTTGSVKTASYLLDGLKALASDSLGVTQ